MLSDRDYMNRGGRRSPQPGEENPNMCIYILIAVNAIVYLSVSRELDLFDKLALSSIGLKLHMYWQIITSMFMHGGFTHILVNMWGLYLFGTLVAPHLKTARFLILYFTAGLCGNFLWLAFNWKSVAYMEQSFGGQTFYTLLDVVGVDVATTSIKAAGAGGAVSLIPFDSILPLSVVGASGALFGILIATAMLEPNREFILLLFPVPMKAKTLVAIYAIIELISTQGPAGNVAHLAHLGGLLGGYLYLIFFCQREIIWDPVQALISLVRKKKYTGRTSSAGWTINTPPLKFNTKPKFDFDKRGSDTPVTQKELDYLLDKVSKSGINSLSESEMATLRKAREQMRRR
ncbi:MAG: rhomboid family intramembrane serine protease [Victivallaceae bacterium]